MKKMFSVFTLILFASLYSGTLKAQNEFAPIGAEWFHDMSDDGLDYFGSKVYYSKVMGDSLIDGIKARHIAIRPYFDEDNIDDDNETEVKGVLRYNYYVYNAGDTVFYYNGLFKKFTPLYIFNVQVGDTLKMHNAPRVACLGSKDSNYFSIVIDSVKMVDWGGVMLKTVYNHPLFDTSSNGRALYHYRYAYIYNDLGVYVEKLGSPNAGFLPLLFGEDSTIDASAPEWPSECQQPTTLRCCSEPATVRGAISVNMVDTSCDFGLLAKASINKNTKSFSNVDIYPNPVSHTLYLANLPIGVNIAVFDVMGRKMFSSSVQQSNFKINTESWAQGVYLVQLNYQGERWMEKVVK